MGIERKAEFYDKIYKAGYNTAFYFKLYDRVMKKILKVKNPNILEVGCGSGLLASMIIFDLNIPYIGLDFSEIAISIAKKRGVNCFVGNAYDKVHYDRDYNILLAIEVMEHLSNDLQIIRLAKPKTNFIMTLPYSDDKAHVRFFRKAEEIVGRYSKFFNKFRIDKVVYPKNVFWLITGIKK